MTLVKNAYQNASILRESGQSGRLSSLSVVQNPVLTDVVERMELLMQNMVPGRARKLGKRSAAIAAFDVRGLSPAERSSFEYLKYGVPDGEHPVDFYDGWACYFDAELALRRGDFVAFNRHIAKTLAHFGNSDAKVANAAAERWRNEYTSKGGKSTASKYLILELRCIWFFNEVRPSRGWGIGNMAQIKAVEIAVADIESFIAKQSQVRGYKCLATVKHVGKRVEAWMEDKSGPVWAAFIGKQDL